jgi:hypothetical protein
MADVYMVTGAEGRNCMVQLSFGSKHSSSEWVSYDSDTLADRTTPSDEVEDQDEKEDTAIKEMVNTFSFNQNQGRIAPLVMMTPEDPKSQPWVMVSVYTDTLFSKGIRIGHANSSLSDFPNYDHGNPSKPKYLALLPMPGNAMNLTPPSVLVVIEQHTTDDLVRHSRKNIKPMIYIIRSYVFLGRNLTYEGMRTDVDPDFFSVRVNCAGMSHSTPMLQGPRPSWMKPVELRVILCSDSTKTEPTIEPITLTLMRGGTVSNVDMGKAVAVYTHIRSKDQTGKWAPFDLQPQWIKLFGGLYGNQCMGQILVAFELLLAKYQDDTRLAPRLMWPQPEESFCPKEHLCKLRKATLHFSINGLRDLLPLPAATLGSSPVTKPVVIVDIPSLIEPDEEADEVRSINQLEFKYREVVPGADARVKANCFKTWALPAQGTQCNNFEFLQVGKLKVEIPDKTLLQPYLRIRVFQEPTTYALVGALSGPTLIGESLQSLTKYLPCCWLDGVRMDRPFDDQIKHIRAQIDQANFKAWSKERF